MKKTEPAKGNPIKADTVKEKTAAKAKADETSPAKAGGSVTDRPTYNPPAAATQGSSFRQLPQTLPQHLRRMFRFPTREVFDLLAARNARRDDLDIATSRFNRGSEAAIADF
jgi:hypothetical protein